VDEPVKIRVPGTQCLDLPDGMQSSGVVLATEGAPNLWEGSLCELLDQVHGDLPGVRDAPDVALVLELGWLKIELGSNGPDNGVNGNAALMAAYD